MNLTDFLAYLRSHESTKKWAVVFNDVVGGSRPTIPGSSRRTTAAEQ